MQKILAEIYQDMRGVQVVKYKTFLKKTHFVAKKRRKVGVKSKKSSKFAGRKENEA